MKKYYVHVPGGSRGNSHKGINFGSLDSREIPGFTKETYRGNLLSWCIYHSSPLNSKQAVEAARKYRGIITNAPVKTHSQAMTMKDLFSHPQWRENRKVEEIDGFPVVGLE